MVMNISLVSVSVPSHLFIHLGSLPPGAGSPLFPPLSNSHNLFNSPSIGISPSSLGSSSYLFLNHPIYQSYPMVPSTCHCLSQPTKLPFFPLFSHLVLISPFLQTLSLHALPSSTHHSHFPSTQPISLSPKVMPSPGYQTFHLSLTYFFSPRAVFPLVWDLVNHHLP